MHGAIPSALSAALLLASASVGAATSLVGAPFVVSPNTDGAVVTSYAFAAGERGFGVLVGEDRTANFQPETILLRLFDNTGKPRGRPKKLLGDGRMKADRGGGLWPAGGLPLVKGDVFVSAYSQRLKGQSEKAGGLIGQVSGVGRSNSEQFSVDQSAPAPFEYGGLIPLDPQRGLAYWQASDKGSPAGARFISQYGEMSAPISLQRKSSFVSSVSPYMGGFIVTFTEQKGSSLILKIVQQIFDRHGKPSDLTREISDPPPFWAAIYSRLTGLQDGGILFTTIVQDEDGTKLTGEVLDSNWKQLAFSKTLLAVDHKYVQIVPLPGEGSLSESRRRTKKAKSALRSVALLRRSLRSARRPESKTLVSRTTRKSSV